MKAKQRSECWGRSTRLKAEEREKDGGRYTCERRERSRTAACADDAHLCSCSETLEWRAGRRCHLPRCASRHPGGNPTESAPIEHPRMDEIPLKAPLLVETTQRTMFFMVVLIVKKVSPVLVYYAETTLVHCRKKNRWCPGRKLPVPFLLRTFPSTLEHNASCNSKNG